MRALQALVVIMGVLLLAGTAVVVGTILSRLGARGHDRLASAPLSPAANGASHADLVLPADSRIVSATSIGERILLDVTAPAGESLLVVDPVSGAVLHRLDVRKASVAQP